MRILLRYVRPHRFVLIAALIVALAASAAGLAQPLAAKAVIDALRSDGGMAGPVLTLAVVVVCGALLTAGYMWILGRTAERVVYSVRMRLVARMLRLRVPELDRTKPGDLVARVTSDSTLLNHAATTAIVDLVKGGAGFTGGLVVMAVLDLRLFGITVATLALAAILVGVLLPKVKAAVVRAQEGVGGVGAELDRALGAARTVKASGAESREEAAVEGAARTAMHAGFAGARYTAGIGAITYVSIQIPFLTVLGAGGVLVAAGSLELSTLIAFLLTLFYLTEPVMEGISAMSDLQQGLGAAKRINEVEQLEMESDVDSPAAASTVDDGPPEIEIDGVSLRYPGGRTALNEVSFRTPAGGQTAIVGPSGAGKTSLFALLQRFFEPGSGVLRVGGQDIGELSRAELRRRIGYVEQDSPVLAGTLRLNLTYAAPDADHDEIDRVLRLTALDELVATLPDGLDTQVGNRGVALSGGQRQRLAIARALLRRPSVLLLDEATANLDARTEHALRHTVETVSEQCTVLLIAHRLSTVTAADRIVLLDQGTVRGVGTHAELIARSPLYRELATSQLLVSTEDTVSS